MKGLLFTIFMSLFFITITHARAEDCRVVNSENGQTHSICTIEGKDFHFLDIHGPMKDLAYYHGKFLASEMRKGVLQAVMDRRDESLNAMTKADRAQFQSVYACIMNRYERSVGDDLISEFKFLAKGARDGGADISDRDVIESSLMVELSGYVDTLMLEMEQNKTKATMDLFSRCGLNLTVNAAKGALAKLARPLMNMKRGCTGFVASTGYSANGEHLHGRNFDSGFIGVFEKYPVVLRHTPDSGVTYMGMSTVGLHYSGGISGMNASGLSISTHELRTTNYRTLYPLRLDLKPLNGKLFKRKTAMTAPYLANEVLRTARTLDEAIDLIKKTGSFGAWSFLISDAKTGEGASIEISGDIVRVAKRAVGRQSQTNHFLAPDTAKDNFEHSIYKSLESRARLGLVNQSLEKDKGHIDVDWGIELLSGHTDFYQGQRSFGRTVSKVYTSMTHVMDVKNKEFWFSVGNNYPTNMTKFVGLKIDFKTPRDFFSFIGQKEGQKELKITSPDFINSLHEYTMAYFAYTGKGRSLESLKETLGHLEAAKTMSLLNGAQDYPISIMLSKVAIRVYALTGDTTYLDLAHQELTGLYSENFNQLHNVERAQVTADLGAVYAFKNDPKQSQQYFRDSLEFLVPLQRQFPDHFYLQKLVGELQSFEKVGITKTDVMAHDLDFATVE